MKKLIALLVFSLSINFMYGQVAVTDPAMLEATVANWGKQLEQAQKQFAEVKEQTKFLQESIDKYKKVNAHIKNAQTVKNLIDRQVKLVSFLSTEINNAGKNVASPTAHQAYVRRLNSLIKQSESNVVSLTEILTDNLLNLTDYERMKMLDDLDTKSASILATAMSEKRQYDELNNGISRINKILAD